MDGGYAGTPRNGIVHLESVLNVSPKILRVGSPGGSGGGAGIDVRSDNVAGPPNSEPPLSISGHYREEILLNGISMIPAVPAIRANSTGILHSANKDPFALLSSSPSSSPMMTGIQPYVAAAALDSQAVLQAMEPELANDERLRADLETLTRAFEANLASLIQAHHLAQQKVMAEARIRQQIPLDFNVLFERAEVQHAIDTEASQAIKQAQEISEVSHIMQSLEAGTFPISEPPSAPVNNEDVSPATTSDTDTTAVISECEGASEAAPERRASRKSSSSSWNPLPVV
jgi:hypothetical protein